MKTYQAVLERFAAIDFGRAAAPRNSEAQQETLRSEVRAVIQSDTKYFNLCIAFLVMLFIGSTILVLCNLSRPASITAISSATGISYAFLLKQAIGLWREKSHAEVGYVLATKLPAEDLKAVVLVLLGARK